MHHSTTPMRLGDDWSDEDLTESLLGGQAGKSLVRGSESYPDEILPQNLNNFGLDSDLYTGVNSYDLFTPITATVSDDLLDVLSDEALEDMAGYSEYLDGLELSHG